MNGNAQKIVATVVIAMLGWIIMDQRSLRGEVIDIRSDIGDLRERMARLEGRLDSLENVIVQVFTKKEGG